MIPIPQQQVNCSFVLAEISKLDLHTSQVAHQAGAYLSFCSMKRIAVFLLPPGWDASPWKSYHKH